MEKKLISQYVGAVITEKTNKNMLKNKGNYGLMALASGFLDLLDNHYLTLGDKNKLQGTTSSSPQEKPLALIYKNIQDSKEKTLKKWLDSYVAGLNGKEYKNYLVALDEFLLESKTVYIDGERGTLIKSENFKANETLLTELKAIIEKALKGNLTLNKLETGTLACLSTGKLISFLTNRESEKAIRKLLKTNPDYKAIKAVLDDMDATTAAIFASIN